MVNLSIIITYGISIKMSEPELNKQMDIEQTQFETFSFSKYVTSCTHSNGCRNSVE